MAAKRTTPTPELTRALLQLAEAGGADLVERARRGELRPAYGVERLVEQVFAALRERRSVLLLGPSGVGKTAVLHEAARRLAAGEAPAELLPGAIVQFSLGQFETGAINRGGWTANWKKVLDPTCQFRRIFLALDPIAELRDAGRYSGYTESFATFLKPFLLRRELVLLGEATEEEYRRTGPSPRSTAPSPWRRTRRWHSASRW